MANPSLTVDVTDFPDDGFVRLMWDNSQKGAGWYSWRLYRRLSTPAGKWTLVREYLYDTSDYEFHDYWAASNVAQEWIVVRVHMVGLVPTEEAIDSPVIDTPLSDNYWLVHPYNIAYNLLLHQVNDDSYSTEAEAGEMNIIGRGRRVDFGSVWGRRGSIAAQVRDRSLTAAQALDRLEAQQRVKTFFWFRNPWGDMFRVRLSDLSVKRVPGVGMNEYADVTLAYAELVT